MPSSWAWGGMGGCTAGGPKGAAVAAHSPRLTSLQLPCQLKVTWLERQKAFVPGCHRSTSGGGREKQAAFLKMGAWPGHKAFVSQLLAECQPDRRTQLGPSACGLPPLTSFMGNSRRGWGPFSHRARDRRSGLVRNQCLGSLGSVAGLGDRVSVSLGCHNTISQTV